MIQLLILFLLSLINVPIPTTQHLYMADYNIYADQETSRLELNIKSFSLLFNQKLNGFELKLSSLINQ